MIGTQQPWDLVIVGAGIAGLTTALWGRRLGLSAVLLEERSEPGGQLHLIQRAITDFPGFPAIEAARLAEVLSEQVVRAGASLHLAEPVRRIDAVAKACLTDRDYYQGRALVIATGVSSRRLGIPGETNLDNAKLIRRPSLELNWFAAKRVIVIGGGDRAAENALLLARVAHSVTIIHRGETLRAREPFIKELQRNSSVKILLQSQVQEFQLNGTKFTAFVDVNGRPCTMEADAACIYIGNEPNTLLLRGQIELDDEGNPLTDSFGQTNVTGLYAVGDVATEPAFQSLVGPAGQAMRIAKQVALALQK